jgi:chemotaxis protein histidine kinase CheA
MVGFYPRGDDKTEFWTNYWKMLHLITYLYPEIPTEQDKTEMEALANRLSTHLPYKCKRCIYHYRANLKHYPLVERYSNRKDLTEWLIDIHNSVNSSRRKRNFSYQEVHEMYRDVEQVNQSLIDGYGLDVKGFLANPDNRPLQLVHIGHKRIIGKIIARHEQKKILSRDTAPSASNPNEQPERDNENKESDSESSENDSRVPQLETSDQTKSAVEEQSAEPTNDQPKQKSEEQSSANPPKAEREEQPINDQPQPEAEGKSSANPPKAESEEQPTNDQPQPEVAVQSSANPTKAESKVQSSANPTKAESEEQPTNDQPKPEVEIQSSANPTKAESEEQTKTAETKSDAKTSTKPKKKKTNKRKGEKMAEKSAQSTEVKKRTNPQASEITETNHLTEKKHPILAKRIAASDIRNITEPVKTLTANRIRLSGLLHKSGKGPEVSMTGERSTRS